MIHASGDSTCSDHALVARMPLSVMIISEIRFLRESLGEILGRTPSLDICGQCATLAEAVGTADELRPNVILLDVAFSGGPQAAARLAAVYPDARVIALAVIETGENVLAWAEAGIAGYVPNTASVDELIAQIWQIFRGEQACPSHISGSLLRRIAAAAGPAARPGLPSSLTQREMEILRLVGSGLSNKAIARQLGISLSTTKTHVHSLLAKLNLQRRTEVAARMMAGLEPFPAVAGFAGSILAPSPDR